MSGKIRIICFGDSNTYGYMPGHVLGGRYDESETWPAILQEMLGPAFEVINEGLNGRTIASDRPGRTDSNGLKALPGILEKDAPADVIIIMLGTNDCTSTLGLTDLQIMEGMEKLIECTDAEMKKLQGFESEIIVAAPPAILPSIAGTPFEDELDGTSVHKSRQLPALFKEAARKHNCIFADTSKEAEVSPVDCEHLTADGHRVVARIMHDTIMSSL